MDFDRAAAFGKRLDIPAGTAVRFEPGVSKEVMLVAFGGEQRLTGLNNLTNGDSADAEVRDAALAQARRADSREHSVVTIDRKDYAALYGPTTGDSVRLGDTS